MITIALPGGKSLEERTLELFESANIRVVREGSSCHEVLFPYYPGIIKGVFVKPRRAPKLVEKGSYDVAITGMDMVLESGADVEVYASLSYSRSTSQKTYGVLFATRDDPISKAADIPPGSVILTEYPNITSSFFKKLGVSVFLEATTGSTEAEIPRDYRFGVCLSETGASLKQNGLKSIGIVFESHTALIVNKESLNDPRKVEEIYALKKILLGALNARNWLLVSMNVPMKDKDEILSILPSLHSPTVSMLAGDDAFISVSSIVAKSEVNALIPRLMRRGAEGLLVQQVSSVIQTW